MPAGLVVGGGHELTLAHEWALGVSYTFCHVGLTCTILSMALELAVLPNQSLWQMWH